MVNNKDLLLVWAISLIALMFTLYSIACLTHALAQIFPKNNTQSTSPNNRTSIMVVINHGIGNFTLSDFLPTFITNRCPLTAHLIDNNNLKNSSVIAAKPVMICYT